MFFDYFFELPVKLIETTIFTAIISMNKLISKCSTKNELNQQKLYSVDNIYSKKMIIFCIIFNYALIAVFFYSDTSKSDGKNTKIQISN